MVGRTVDSPPPYRVTYTPVPTYNTDTNIDTATSTPAPRYNVTDVDGALQEVLLGSPVVDDFGNEINKPIRRVPGKRVGWRQHLVFVLLNMLLLAVPVGVLVVTFKVAGNAVATEDALDTTSATAASTAAAAVPTVPVDDEKSYVLKVGEWTIDYSNYTSVLLTPAQYASICASTPHHHSPDFWSLPPTYIDPATITPLPQPPAPPPSPSYYFLPLPEQGCTPPPREVMVACPHASRHWVVSRSTWSTFGHQFDEWMEDPRKVGALRQRAIFRMAEAGMRALWKLRPELAGGVAWEVERMNAIDDGGWIGVHVRHGDAKPYMLRYGETELGVEVYMGGVETVANLTRVEGDLTPQSVFLISDDPFAAEGFPDDIYAPGAGLPTPAAPFTYLAFQSSSTPALRAQIAASFIVDISIAMTKASRGVVCAISSGACRIIALGLGWEVGILGRRWWNVDGDFDWRGVDW
ncbi:hypothetical protein YB2330_003906 [Saitoella coloradoensis]